MVLGVSGEILGWAPTSPGSPPWTGGWGRCPDLDLRRSSRRGRKTKRVDAVYSKNSNKNEQEAESAESE